MNVKQSASSDYRTVVGRCLRLRCPACGEGKFSKTWFQAHEQCSHCSYDFVREPGFYLGSIYINYGLTAGILVAICSPLVLFTNVPFGVITPIAVTFCIAFPTWFHRYARALWLGFDYRWDGFRNHNPTHSPSGDEKETAESEDPSAPQATKPPPKTATDDVIATCPFCHARNRQPRGKLNAWIDCQKCQRQILVSQSGGPIDEADDAAPRD